MNRQPAEAGSVVVNGLVHRYATSEADVLDDVKLTIEAGTSLALLGPSGCGKTTLLRAIAGLERPRAGTITIDDEPLLGPATWVPPERRRVGMVFQDWALFPHMTVARNVAYGLPRGPERAQRVREALDLVGLADHDDRMPSTLSGGQQQRVALARTLAPRPRVLLLDEPFSNLDTNLRAEVRAEVRRLLIEVGITAVFVTHDQEEAFVLGDQVAVMRHGRIEQLATPQELYRAPMNRWVAEFVGDATVIRGVARGSVAVTDIGDVPLDRNHSGTVEVLLRPEQLAIEPGDDAEIELVEFFGHDAMVHVRYGEHPIQVRTHAESDLGRGARVGLRFVGTAARAFALDHDPEHA